MTGTIIDLPIVGQSYHLENWSVDCQRTLNLFPQFVESGNAPQISALFPTAGLIKRFEFDSYIRGMYAMSDRFFVVAGQKLLSIKPDNTVKELGEVTGIGRVYFADNSVQLMIVSNNSYSLDLKSDVLKKLELGDFFGASDVTALDSRFIWTVPKSGKFQWSNLLSTDTTALSYATAEAKSDNLVRTIENNGQLWMIGEKTTEIWSSTNSSDAPFQRMGGAVIPTGCVAPASVCQFGTSLAWVSRTAHGQGVIVITEGYATTRISNHAIEADISSYKSIEDAYSISYQENGHSFLLITFPSAKKTWCYDGTTKMWHERSFFNQKTSLHEHHRAFVHCFFNGKQLVGDRQNGKIYELSTRSNTDDGNVIVRERVTPVINPQAQRLIFHELEVIAQMGQDTNERPLLMVDWSNDKGRTWSYTHQKDLGGIGEFEKRLIFRRLGQSFNRVFRFRMTDASKLVITGAKVRVSQ
ncbi:packaged DNA stabilization protein [Acinetobacter seifertii]|uniref:packaged DNA stabilization protein n=1 Tax=Acinetobacter seifertii TaxID=1530123 RepID=UPI003F5282A4